MKFSESDFHKHILARMEQRGVTQQDIQTTFEKGWDADNLKEGTLGKVFVFEYNNTWEGKTYEEKEVSVYYKIKDEKVILLTAMARYGKCFKKKEL